LICQFDHKVLSIIINTRKRRYKVSGHTELNEEVTVVGRREWVCDDPTQYKNGPNNVFEECFHQAHHLGDYNIEFPIR
jgi:hypothetical protein